MNLEHRVPLLREEMFPMNPHLLPLQQGPTAAKVQSLSPQGLVRVVVIESLSYKMNLEHRVPLLREEMFPMNPHLLPLQQGPTAAKVQSLSPQGLVRVVVIESLSYKMNLEHRVPLLREEMFPMNPHLRLLLMASLKNNKILVIWTSSIPAKVQLVLSLTPVGHKLNLPLLRDKMTQ